MSEGNAMPDPTSDPQPTPDLKSGWLSTEFWIALLPKIIAILAMIGFVPSGDVNNLTAMAIKGITAMGIVISVTMGAVAYGKRRTSLKRQQMAGGRPDTSWLMILLFLGLLASPCSAQSPLVPVTQRATTGTAAEVKTNGFQLGIVNFSGRRQPQQQAPAPAAPQTDPAVLQMLGTIAQNQQQMLLLMAKQASPQPPSQTQPPSPTPAPQLYLLPTQPASPSPGYAPQQVLPIGGTPQQVLPIAGAPQQVLPIAGAPQQQLPISGQPQQIIHIYGTPQQTLPITGVPGQGPQQQLPSAPAPVPVAPIDQAQPPSPTPPPGTIKPAPGSPQQQLMPGAYAPPAPQPQRYSYYDSVYPVASQPKRPSYYDSVYPPARRPLVPVTQPR